MKLLFMDYKSSMRTNGLKCVTEKTPKLAVKLVLSAVRPVLPRPQLEQGIGFSPHHLKADFSSFMEHALDIS